MVSGNSKALSCGSVSFKIGLALLLFLEISFSSLIDRVVANVNGEPLLESEVNMARLFYGNTDRQTLIKMLIDKRLIAQFLREKGFNTPEKYLNKVIEDIARSNGKTVEQLITDLSRAGFTLEDLKNFLRVEILSTAGLQEYLKHRIEITEIEIELERLKKGEIEYVREIELLVISKDKKEEVLEFTEKNKLDITQLANHLGIKIERLKVKKGDLIEPLDKEVWEVEKGHTVIAEDDENIYFAKILREIKVFSGRSEEEIREQLLLRKMEEEREKLVKQLRKERFVEVY